MKVTWLGQAGLLFENGDLKIIVDPYLSDSCEKLNPKSKRRMPVCEKVFDIKPDIIICTHNHLDHLDPETLGHFLGEDTNVTVLCSENGFAEVRKFGGDNNYVMMHPGVQWTQNGVVFTAVGADHSELSAIGIIIDDGEDKFYITGDTLFNRYILEEIPEDIYALFLPINGKGNNMNMCDAAQFAEEIDPQWVVPVHWGLFDSINPEEFDCENKCIPEIYEEIKFRD